MGQVVLFHARASAGSTGHKSGRSSDREMPVSRSIGNTNSAGTPFFDDVSQYQTWDCVVPMRLANRVWPPTASHARRSASVDMEPPYPKLSENQPKSLWKTDNQILGNPVPMREPDKKAMGERIRRLRLKRGMSQKKLAEGAGMSQQGIYNLEHGSSERPRKLKEIAECLWTTEDYLLWKIGPEEVGPDPAAQLRAIIEEMDRAEQMELLRYVLTQRRA